MKTLFSNRYADALAKTILFFGSIHLIVLTSIVLHGNIDALNAFHILSLDSIVPRLGHGTFNFIFSWFIVLMEYCLACLIRTKPVKQNVQEPA